ncbi:ABC transporter ATP-binding protein [Pleionea sediminis]|uniref:ABC transporter ATP-binding protein n=1 Tax=Pleionea sediminis TaxID=2569479 RepID=UPI0011853559|nr:ABC transporter ATP-binding protein [Pleionea sediminis]
MENIIEVKNLQKSFKKNVVISNLSFSVKQGSVLGLLGTNGAGKTTLLQTMLGFESKDEGICTILGSDSPNLSAKVKQKISFVPQEPGLLEWMKVKQIIAYTKSFYCEWDDSLVDQLLKEWSIDSEQVIDKMSVGQKQKLAIILALANKPEILILDEPVASLDPVSRRNFIKKLIELNLDENRSILFSTHITSDLERVAAEVMILKDGANFFQGEIDQLKDKVVRLHVKSKSPLPEHLDFTTVKYERSGNTAQIITMNFNELDVEQLKLSLDADIQVEYLSLEDIFVEVHS